MEANSSLPLLKLGIKRIQGIVGSLLHYARDVNNNLIMALRAIDYQQASATERTSVAIDQLLNYVTM